MAKIVHNKGATIEVSRLGNEAIQLIVTTDEYETTLQFDDMEKDILKRMLDNPESEDTIEFA